MRVVVGEVERRQERPHRRELGRRQGSELREVDGLVDGVEEDVEAPPVGACGGMHREENGLRRPRPGAS